MTQSAPVELVPQSVRSDEEQRLRIDLAAAYRLVAHFGWDDLIFTHISARIPGPQECFLLNPFGLLFSEITASSLVKVDLSGKLLSDTPYQINPTGFTIHSAVHEGREDAACVMHLHTISGVGVSCQERGLLPISQMAMGVGSLSYHDYEGLALSHEERPRLVADLGRNYSMMLRNHGTLTVGRTVAEAFLRMYRLERACAMQVAAQSGGAALRYPSDSVQALTAQQAAGTCASAAARVWPALVRMLDAKDKSFRD